MTTPAKQQQILFVDDETNFLDTVRALFTSWSKNSWQVECATSADQALEILKTRSFDLVVVDVNMPVIDGEQFLRILARRFPGLKKAAITGHATEERRSACLASGAELFIEKPRSSEGLKSIFVMLDELVTWKQQTGFQGMLRRVGLQDVIQMECLGRNSSILEVADRKLTGQIYIQDGRIIHAIVGEMTGEPAFQKLLALPGGSFELQHFEPPGEQTIEGQWEFLLMEAARVHDETSPQAAAAEAAVVSEPPPAVDGPPPALKTPAESRDVSPRVMETLICSGQGMPLYQWQCADAKTRVALMVGIAQQAKRAGQLLALGKFDRLEISLPDSRALAQVKSDRMVFVQVAMKTENS